MGQVSVTLNNRTYKLACNDGEEPRLALLARDVKSRVENLAREFGQPADERILLMAAVLLADELMDLREAHEAMLAAAAEVLREAAGQSSSAADGGKPDGGKSESPKHVASKPEPSQQDAAKAQPRSQQQGGNGGSGHPALPQAQTKGAKTSAA